MVKNLSEILSGLKANWTQVVNTEAIEESCRELALSWRERILTPAQTVQLFILQILHGNTALSHIRFFTTKGFSAAAYCKARSRLPVALFEKLLAKMAARFRCQTQLWCGRRLYLVDGSTFSMPDRPELVKHFGQPTGQKKGCGFPVAHFVGLFDAGTGLIRKVLSGPLFSHDLPNCVKLHSALTATDVLVGDRAFCSFAHLALVWRRSVDAVFRMQASIIVNFRSGRPQARSRGDRLKPRSRWEKRLGVRDQLVTWFKPATPAPWMTEWQHRLLPATLLLRELAYDVHRRGFRTRRIILVTTLLNPNEFPLSVLADVYNQRWTIETNFGHLKTTMRMDVLHCQTVDGVLKEFYMFCLVYNLVRTVMLKFSESQGCHPKQLSFVDALRWLSCSCIHRILQPIEQIPFRPNRYEPRLKKRRPKNYGYLQKTRKSYKKNEGLCLS